MARRKTTRTRNLLLATAAYASHGEGLYGSDFASKALPNHLDPKKQVSGWVRADTFIKASTALEAEQHVPGTAWVRHHPMFELLTGERMTTRSIKRTLSDYSFDGDHNGFECVLPSDAIADARFEQTFDEHDPTLAYVARGDLHGYSVALAAFRLAGLAKDGGVQLFMAANLIRGLPLIERLPWIVKHRSLLRSCLSDVLQLAVWDGPGFAVNWRALDRLSRQSSWEQWLDCVLGRDGSENPIAFYKACLSRESE